MLPPLLGVSHEKRGSRTQGLQSRRHPPPPAAAADRSATAVDYFRGAKRLRSHRDLDDPLQQQQYPEPSGGSEGARGSAAAAQPDPRLAAAFYTPSATAQGDAGWRWRGQYSYGAQPLFAAAQSHAAAGGDVGRTGVIGGASAAAQDAGFGHAVGFSGAQSVQEGDVRWAAGPTPQLYDHHAGAAAQTAAAVQQQQQHGQDGQNGRQDWARGNAVAGGGGNGGQQSCAAQQVSIMTCCISPGSQ